jgi:16S rRNA (uracil1498-N3)-methyltransferase
MSLPVHWVESLHGVRPGDRVTIEDDEAHHAVTVRRLRVGEPVAITDGRGTTVLGSVADVAKRRLTVAAEQVDHTDEPVPGFTVVQALPKGDRGELAV